MSDQETAATAIRTAMAINPQSGLRRNRVRMSTDTAASSRKRDRTGSVAPASPEDDQPAGEQCQRRRYRARVELRDGDWRKRKRGGGNERQANCGGDM